MDRYVLVDAYGKYVNTILWDGASPLTLPPGVTAVGEEEYTPVVGEGSPYHVWNDSTHQYDLSTDLLQAARDARWEDCKRYRDDVRNNGGFLVAGTYWFHSDTPSKIDQLGLVNAMMMNVLPPVEWSLLDGSTALLTPTLVQQIFQTAMTVRGSNFAISKAHKASIYASTDPLNYDFTGGGWVPIFGE